MNTAALIVACFAGVFAFAFLITGCIVLLLPSENTNFQTLSINLQKESSSARNT